MDETVSRTKNGWLEPVFYREVRTGTVRRYSDRLLICLLEIWMPEKFPR
jgi:hypothetical protein